MLNYSTEEMAHELLQTIQKEYKTEEIQHNGIGENWGWEEYLD